MPQSEGGATTATVRAFGYDDGAPNAVFSRDIAEEVPVAIAFGGLPFAVMMATPLDIEDFVYGFALTEGAIRAASDIRAITMTREARGLRADVTLTGAALGAHLARRRTLSGRSGCGLCGVEDFADLPKVRARPTSGQKASPRAIGAALVGLAAAQPLNARTRAVHAAAWCSAEGAIQAVREDVGRHNALDKLIGALLRDGANADEGFILITSRCSFEMVVKTATFGAATLVAVSAPTTLALETAAACGVTLIAIARADGALAFDADLACGAAA